MGLIVTTFLRKCVPPVVLAQRQGADSSKVRFNTLQCPETLSRSCAGNT